MRHRFIGMIAAAVTMLACAGEARAQCPNNNTLTGSAVTPPCPGTTTVPCVQGGQYALVNVTTGNIYTFSTCSSTAFDTQITLYNNTGGGSLGYNDDGCGLQSTVTWTATYTGQIRVLVDQYPCASNTVCIPVTITCAAPPPPVTNDNPCQAIVVPVTVNCSMQTFSNVGATATPGVPAPTCGLYTGADVWFRFVAPASGLAIIETAAGSMTDATMALYSAPSCSGPFTQIACDDDSGPGLMPFENVSGLVPGQTYYLRVFGFFGVTGTFTLCIHAPTMPSGTCIYMLQMYDSFGDGWGGSTVSISVNGGAFVPYTTTGPYNIVLIGLNPGNVIVVQYNASGPFQGENLYTLSLLSGGGAIFNSGTPPAAGIVFTQTVTCNPPPTPPQDCAGGITVCSGQSFSNNSNNTGDVQDLNASNQGCLSSGERQGTWYYFSPSSAGTIGFTIAPSVPTDYDFALWGPMTTVTCPPVGPPLRCSYSALFTNTGLGNGAADVTEGAGGDAWVSTINVAVGQIYILYIDNFSTNGQSFSLTWQLTNGASLDCTVLPIELLSFSAQAVEEGVDLHWVTASEENSDRFEVERSADGEHFALIGSLPSAGNSAQELHYGFLDRTPLAGLNHYRLRHVDIDGQEEHSPVRSVFVDRAGKDEVVMIPNPGSASVQVLLPTDEAGAVFVMTDAVGHEVLRTRTDGSRLTLDTSRLPHGLYGFRLVLPSGAVIGRGTWVRE